MLARLFPALGLQHLVMSGGLPDTPLALRFMDEIVYPLATAPPAPAPARMPPRKGSRMNDREGARVRKAAT